VHQGCGQTHEGHHLPVPLPNSITGQLSCRDILKSLYMWWLLSRRVLCSTSDWLNMRQKSHLTPLGNLHTYFRENETLKTARVSVRALMLRSASRRFLCSIYSPQTSEVRAQAWTRRNITLFSASAVAGFSFCVSLVFLLLPDGATVTFC
jgi:hypothetical protein